MDLIKGGQGRIAKEIEDGMINFAATLIIGAVLIFGAYFVSNF